MTFKYPLLLWGLLLLIIPIIVHLYRLRKFKITPFTNVAMMQRAVVESKKSRSLKKWLLLVTRLLLLLFLILAFAQPFFGDKQDLSKENLVIYLDNSMSLGYVNNGTSLLNQNIQQLVQSIDENQVFSLFTNTQVFNNIRINQIKNILLDTKVQSGQLTLEEVILKAQTLFNHTSKSKQRLVLLTDLDKNMDRFYTRDTTIITDVYLSRPRQNNNIFIDTLWISDEEADRQILHATIKGLQENKEVPVKLFDGQTIIGQKTVKGDNNGLSNFTLTLPKASVERGMLQLPEDGLDFDNKLYFSQSAKRKPKILVVNDTEEDFIDRIYKNDEFDYSFFTSKTLEYSQISKNDILVFLGVSSYPNSLVKLIKEFKNKGGRLVISPPQNPDDLVDFNVFTKSLLGLELINYQNEDNSISNIAYDHPLFNKVFTKRITNFDYPMTRATYQSTRILKPVLSYENGSGFLLESDKSFIFLTPLVKEYTDFIEHPLVVPTFGQFAFQSAPTIKPYYNTDTQETLSVENTSDQQGLFQLATENFSIIPIQRSRPNQLELTMGEPLPKGGIYALIRDNDTIQYLGFNMSRQESSLEYLNESSFPDFNFINQEDMALAGWTGTDTSPQYWKWLLIFASVCALFELLIQKLL